MADGHDHGPAAQDLDDASLLQELESLHGTRNTTLRHAPADALTAHTRRTTELEDEYVRRFPEREVDAGRTREGARER